MNYHPSLRFLFPPVLLRRSQGFAGAHSLSLTLTLTPPTLNLKTTGGDNSKECTPSHDQSHKVQLAL